MKQALILVGGKGSRLGALSVATPKPLLTVGGRPFLDYVSEILAQQGIEEIVLLAGHLGDQLEAYTAHWNATQRVRMHCIVEDQPSGTAGAIWQAKALLDDTFVMLNGDSLFDIDLQALANISAPADWVAKIALRRVEDGSRYGEVQIEANKILRFCDGGAPGPATINGGVYILRRSIVDFIAAVPSSIERDVFPKLAEGGRLMGKVFDSFFIDIGIPSDFERAQDVVPLHICSGYRSQPR